MRAHKICIFPNLDSNGFSHDSELRFKITNSGRLFLLSVCTRDRGGEREMTDKKRKKPEKQRRRRAAVASERRKRAVSSIFLLIYEI